jgi:hypothetical protein
MHKYPICYRQTPRLSPGYRSTRAERSRNFRQIYCVYALFVSGSPSFSRCLVCWVVVVRWLVALLHFLPGFVRLAKTQMRKLSCRCPPHYCPTVAPLLPHYLVVNSCSRSACFCQNFKSVCQFS